MNHKKVYTVFQINLIVFYITCIMLIPLICVVSFLFGFHLYTSVNTVFLIASLILLVFFVVGLISILLKRKETERKLKPSYYREMTYVIIVSSLGVLGLGIMYMYFGGTSYYVPHVITPTGIVMYTVLYLIGVRYFNVSLLRRR